MTRYDVTGPYVSRGVSTWIVWERRAGCIAQTLSTHASEHAAIAAAHAAALEYHEDREAQRSLADLEQSRRDAR
jgi:hypothetical protein